MKAVLLYLTLVGLPLLALLAVLRIGGRLTAPRAVHGVYVVAFDSTGRGPCLSELLAKPTSDIVVNQSGTRLDIEIDDVLLIGSIAGDSLHAASRRRTSRALQTAGCLTVDTLKLEGAVTRDGSAKHLIGRLLFIGCQSCAPAPFRATRSVDRSRAKGV